MHAAVVEQVGDGGVVDDLDANRPRPRRQRVDQAPAAPDHVHHRATPEGEAVADLERLAAVAGLKANAVAGHPAEIVSTVGDERLGQVRVTAVFGDPGQVVQELLGRVRPEVGVGHLGISEIGHQGSQVVDAVVDSPHESAGERTVAAGQSFRRPLEQRHIGALFTGRDRRAQPGIAAPDHDHPAPGHRPECGRPSGVATIRCSTGRNRSSCRQAERQRGRAGPGFRMLAVCRSFRIHHGVAVADLKRTVVVFQ